MATDNYNAHTWNVGDIIDGTFCYTASIPAFFIVTRKSDSCVWLVSIGKRRHAQDRYNNGEYEDDPTEFENTHTELIKTE